LAPPQIDGGIKQKILELIPTSSSRNIDQNRQKLENNGQKGRSNGEENKKEIEETTSASEATGEKRFCFYGDENKRRRMEVRAPPPEVT
jgi:hypothetical protein